ncbi:MULTISPECIES: hypothetical protein [Rhizobium/Agrobacterium group]|uniref:hypothetical protein n=1 Tax=Rhizobium/Agrobacterium group TaxID=227290 RepID=UPI001ADA55C8|nr:MULTISPECIES: hypothetical protein [Rhizobium/Agrobacterium group]MBO9112489.1 hypothetical protein [Agrobacterium sp. S2/73]QXZ75996.1 hypothetical protein J5276_28360 [Agrobacterium sp. S7/73]QYA16993.1 hypothetical protein J5284_33145 [Rhizobium sp. AB2/73]UEQ85434.1 hypothetical protein I8E17_30915 [Rhizobium sp. AB2/73]
MNLKKKQDTSISCSDLPQANVDGTRLSGSLAVSEQFGETNAPVKRSFFQQLLLDFAYGCDFFYPVHQFEDCKAKAKDEE